VDGDGNICGYGLTTGMDFLYVPNINYSA